MIFDPALERRAFCLVVHMRSNLYMIPTVRSAWDISEFLISFQSSEITCEQARTVPIIAISLISILLWIVLRWEFFRSYYRSESSLCMASSRNWLVVTTQISIRVSSIHIAARFQCPRTFLCRFFPNIKSWILEGAGIKVLCFCKDHRRSDCGASRFLKTSLQL